MRRGKGEGSVYKQKDGLWCAVIPAIGGAPRKPFRAKTRGAALEKRTNHLAARARGVQETRASKGSLLAYLEPWVEEHPVAESSRKAYRGHIVNHIGPALGRKRLTALESDDVRNFLTALAAKGVSKATVVRIRATLSKALNDAVDKKLIGFNPCAYAKAPPAPSGKLAHRPLREEDIPLFISVAKEHYLWPLWALLLGTGMRMGEALKLHWGDVSLKAGSVHVRGGKSKTSDRVIPLTDWTLAALEELEGRKGLVFATKTGKAIDGRNINRYFHKLLDDAGIDNRRPHDMRPHLCEHHPGRDRRPAVDLRAPRTRWRHHHVAVLRIRELEGEGCRYQATERVGLMKTKRLTYSVEEAAEAVGIGRSLAWRMVRDGQMPCLRVGRRVVVPIAELELWVRSRA